MPATLPLELLFEIASILHLAGDCLAPYTTVCRRWQAAFEPFIYSNLIVYSDNAYKEEGQKGISLAHFQKATTGSGSFRRVWIERLQYDILVPFELLDWTTHKKEGYSVDNPVREANDQAFQRAITALFEILSSWNQDHRLSLELGLLGRQMGESPAPEPHTWHFDIAGDYRPRFHQIWAGAVAQIVQHCPSITQLHLNLDEYVRPDHIEYIQARRDELDNVPPFLPSGKWLALPTPEEQARIDEPDDEISNPDDVICDLERGHASREMVDDEEYHRFFTSTGHAARHMPRLKSIKFHLEHSTWLDFSFRTDSDPITAKWYSDATPEYHPDRRVAEAWGFQIEDFHFEPDDFDTVVNFACWPPRDV
ncbi:hypothetical protein BDV33DRAFT_232472 [Aspergillus novoparasiticus]|uniref:Uncharacterized protein n=1 Tax=Aspergillus novoparasiticus TaxID=986946 RepID=A0A5N6EM52_9EURO|nr:hypothetical protein BDV33DRAFT_232472 [Aspergillus novoparasiticus]